MQKHRSAAASTSASEVDRPSAIEWMLLALLLLLTRVVVSKFIHIYDDAFITFRYAHHFAEGLGMVFNPGASWEPVLGTTTPGYTFLLGSMEMLGIDALTASTWINRLCDVGSGLLLVFFCGAGRVRALIVGIGWALMPEIARVSVGCMEAPVLLLLTLGAFACLRAKCIGWTGLLAACACTVRPEAVLLVGVIMLELRRSRRDLMRFLLPVALIGIAYSALLIAFYGDPIPNSVRSKAARHGASPWLDTWKEIGTQAFLPRLEYLPALVLAVIGFPRLIVSAGGLGGLARFGSGIVLAYLIARPHTWGWYYYIPLTVWTVSVGFGFARVIERIPRLQSILARCLQPVLALGVVGLLATALLVESRDKVTSRVYEPMAAWAEKVGLERNHLSVLASDVGAIGWYGKGLIIDSEGLTLPMDEISVDGAQPDLIRQYEPDYLLITAVQPKLSVLRDEEDLFRDYYPVQRFSVLGETQLEPSLEELPPSWTQDYIVFRRR
ncbi:MAG: hypothetical protein ACI835_002185 [Planctomycetota bacterium]|jgi:hypothetical protein